MTAKDDLRIQLEGGTGDGQQMESPDLEPVVFGSETYALTTDEAGRPQQTIAGRYRFRLVLPVAPLSNRGWHSAGPAPGAD